MSKHRRIIRSVLLLSVSTIVVHVEASPRMTAGFVEDFHEKEYTRIEAVVDSLRRAGNRLPEGENAEYVLDRQSLILQGDDDALDVVLRRTEALLSLIETLPNAPDLSFQRSQLTDLKQAAEQAPFEANNDTRRSERRQLFLDACGVRRSIATQNPILNFDSIAYIPQNERGGFIGNGSYKGCCPGCEHSWTPEEFRAFDWTKPVTGLSSKNSSAPAILSGYRAGAGSSESILKNKTVSNGRLAGTQLDGNGDFSTSFDLSYDGNSIVFSCAPAGEKTYHLFRANLDGNEIVQLTDGALPDYEPCLLPNGRVVFASLRRLAAHRHHHGDNEPLGLATLFSMAHDGTDLIQLSWHEASELHPVVDNEGYIVYTRWDQIDRSAGTAHNLWRCFPDGRDPRSLGANYPLPHYVLDQDVSTDGVADRPNALLQVQAIPNTTQKYIAIASRHHAHLPGVPVVFDAAYPDDNAMSQTKIITGCELPVEAAGPGNTPTAGIPNGADWFTSPWPLSMDFYLCAGSKYNTGIYLLDRFGNIVILYSGVAANPIPLRGRPIPPELPTRTYQGERDSDSRHKAVIVIDNVYESDFEWPTETSIKAIRVIQLIPRPWTNPLRHEPEVGASRDGIARQILGTVPVEEDGSAFFEAPSGKLIYFQALDETGAAVQSMRSGTYVHPGEVLRCTGCHEDRWNANQSRSLTEIAAVQRPPSTLSPEPSGTLPFNFYTLVSPLADNTCKPCHETRNKGLRDFSYKSMQKKGFYFNADAGTNSSLKAPHGGTRTKAGRFGFRESELGKTLMASHKDRLTPEQLRRIIVWVDANSMELGAYYAAEEQRNGQEKWPLLDMDPENPTGVESELRNPTAEELAGAEVRLRHSSPEKHATPSARFHITRHGLRIDNVTSGEWTMYLRSLDGRMVYCRTIAVPLEKRITCAFPSLAQGVYTIDLVSKGTRVRDHVLMVGAGDR